MGYFLICSLIGTHGGFSEAERAKMLFGEKQLSRSRCGGCKVRLVSAICATCSTLGHQKHSVTASWHCHSCHNSLSALQQIFPGQGSPTSWLHLLPAPLFSLLHRHHHDGAALLHCSISTLKASPCQQAAPEQQAAGGAGQGRFACLSHCSTAPQRCRQRPWEEPSQLLLQRQFQQNEAVPGACPQVQVGAVCLHT